MAEQRDREIASAKKKKMEDRLKAMEAKLIQGGKLMDKVTHTHLRWSTPLLVDSCHFLELSKKIHNLFLTIECSFIYF